METNKIKSFAKEARLLLIDGVLQRLKYWGFDEDGTNTQDLQTTEGGFIFRGKIYTDTSVPEKWETLKKRLTNKQAVKDVVEQAAYTWFNRLIAIKILEENGYIEPTITFTEGMRTPQIVQNAKKGIHQLKGQADKDLLLEYLKEDKEEQAFGLLMTNLCNRNQLLHDIFGRIDDFTEILLPQNVLQKDGLLNLINSNAISTDDYKEVELIGWLYQFYISDKKDEVFKGFKKNKKVRAEDIPAATQIFTPKWIVKYMVENTVGKIYLDYEPTSLLKEEMKYLVKNDSNNLIASKEKQSLIKDITELTLIDPASGSGHILVTGFELLFKMYREEGYTASRAVNSILEHNLYGLDIDDRAMQLARFAVLLKAAQYDADILKKGIIPKVYSFPEASHFTSNELQSFLGHDGHRFTAELKEALQLLNQGKNIGSALKLDLSEEAQNHIQAQYSKWSQRDKDAGGLDAIETSIWNRIHPFLDVLLVLTKKYTAVVANPPYMGNGNMNAILVDYLKNKYKDCSNDFMIVFMKVGQSMVQKNSYWSMINIHSWLTKKDFIGIRDFLTNEQTIESLIHFGRGIFGSDFGTVAFSIKNKLNENDTPTIGRRLFNSFVKVEDPEVKEKRFLDARYKHYEVSQFNFNKLPGCQFGYWLNPRIFYTIEKSNIKKFGDAKQGIKTGENSLFIRNWFELNFNKSSLKTNNAKWYPLDKGGDFRKWYGNNNHMLDWQNDGFRIRNFRNIEGKLKSRPQNTQHFFKDGLTWSTSASYKPSFRFSSDIFTFESSGSKFFLKNDIFDIELIFGFLNSNVGEFLLEVFSLGKGITEGAVKALPFLEIEENFGIKFLVNQNIKISKNDWDSRETSWDYKKSSLLNKSSSLVQAYKNWQEEVSQDFFQLHANEEELNRIFIGIYGLQDELTPEVALKDITILQEDLDRKELEAIEPVFRGQGIDAVSLPIDRAEVIGQFLSYGVGLFMGRYRLDKSGLNIAHPNPSEEELAGYTYNGKNLAIDDDGILPLMGEDSTFPDDVVLRTRELIYAIWGKDSLTENINFIHEALGMDLHKWFTEKFWKFHTTMYKKKPIYWLFSSNTKSPQKAAFKVLVYMHRMVKYTVQKIQRNYLHPHQEYIKKEIESLVENEENLNKQEIKQLEKLRNWELECRDYNEVLKQLAVQEIEFDLDNGVSVNYEEFEGALAVIK